MIAKRGPGRPKDLSKIELITLDEAVEVIRQFFKTEKPPFSRKTLRNKIALGILTRYGPYHKTLVDKAEIIQRLCQVQHDYRRKNNPEKAS